MLKYGAIGKNLFDKEQTYISAFVNANTGELTAASTSQRSFVVGCLPNTTYTLSGMTAASGWGSFTSSTIGTTATSFTKGNGTITTGANDKYLIGLAYVEGSSIYDYRNTLQIERGSTATPYEPYQEGIYTDGEVETIGDSANHTATVATLLGVGDYRDTQNINTGAITRNVGVKVFDGTEDWAIHTSGAMKINVSHPLNIQTIYGICTHFEGVPASVTAANMTIGQFKLANTTNEMFFKTSYDNTTSWKNWLAEQYANGTPVIVIYPLATETTESVAGQTMTTAPVDNRTGGVTGMTITTLLSSGASVVTTIATNAIKIATTAYNTARFSPVVNDLNDTIATIRDVVTNTINQTKAIADLQATKQTRPDENCPAGKKCLLVETEENGVIVPHWFPIIETPEE